MIFHTWEFIGFYGLVYFLYLKLSHNSQNRALLISSYYFYASWDWRFLSLLIISTTVDYICGRRIENAKFPTVKKKLVCASIFTNLSILGIFKYYDFFAQNLQGLLLYFNIKIEPYFLDTVLPVGISFYTFQSMSYTIDVFFGKVKASRNFFDFALYVSFFPQLIAGPIERATRLLPQILQVRVVKLEYFYRGIYLFFWGIVFKILLADNLAKIADPVFASAGPYNGSSVLLATYAFTIQMYCDFAGYSFMAIGLALCMGIELMENFRRPFFSRNISEFWRRWHISLSSWCKDYMFTPLYISLKNLKVFSGFSTKNQVGIIFFFSLLVTLFFLGLWHGPSWNFALFGIYHAFLIGLYYYTSKKWDKLVVPIQITLTFHLVCLGMLIFRANTLRQAWDMFLSIFINFHGELIQERLYLWEQLLIFSGFLFLVEFFQERKNNTFTILRLPLFPRYIFITALLLLVAIFGSFGGQPYIYFQF